jgi:hypothetical protein
MGAVAATAPVELNSIDPATTQPTKALDTLMIALPTETRPCSLAVSGNTKNAEKLHACQ